MYWFSSSISRSHWSSLEHIHITCHCSQGNMVPWLEVLSPSHVSNPKPRGRWAPPGLYGPRTGEGQFLRKRKWSGLEEKKMHDRWAKAIDIHYNYMSFVSPFSGWGYWDFLRLSNKSQILQCRPEIQTQVWLQMTFDYLLCSVACYTFLLLI